jgi:hypothetical protein
VNKHAGRDAKAQWFPINNLPPLAFDHEDIMRNAMKKYQCGHTL